MRKYKLDLDSDDDDDSDIEAGLPGTKALSPEQKEEAMQLALGLPPNPTKRSGLDPIARETEGIVLEHEYVGEEFWKKVWRPPVVAEAEDHRRGRLYGEGLANTLRTTITDSESLSLGMKLYFQFLKSMSAGFLLIFLLSIPLLAFAYYGDGLMVDNQDELGLYKYVLGNIGPSTLQGTGQYDHSWAPCAANLPSATDNTTCIFIDSFQFEHKQVSAIITALELLQVLVFLLVVCHLRCRRGHWLALGQKEYPVSITSYAVCIYNLPIDITEKDLMDHFSGLYQLQKVDWRGRLPVEDARTVQHFGNTEDRAYLDSWVAEATVYREIGSLLASYKLRRRMMERLFRSRAKMKMYRTSTPHPAGEDPARYKRAEDEMMMLARRIDKMTFALKELLLNDFQRRLKPQPKPPVATPAVVVEEKKEVKDSKESNDEEKAVEHENHQDGKDSKVDDSKKRDTKEMSKAAAQSKKKAAQFDDDDDDEKMGLKSLAISADEQKDIEAHMKHDPSVKVAEAVDPQAILDAAMASMTLQAQSNKPKKLYQYMDEARAVCAFVVFEHTESFARCLEDYNHYSSFPFNLCYPKELKIRGYRPHITRAPEPEQIIWENLEASHAHRFCGKLRSCAAIFSLLLASLVILVLASNTRHDYLQQIPSDDMCSQIIPSIYAGVQFNETYILDAMVLVRPNNMSSFDDACQAVIKDTFYATYTANGTTVGNYSMDACGVGYCPSIYTAQHCPCVSTSIDGICETGYCQANTDAGCTGYRADALGLCYCKANMGDLLTWSGFQGYLYRLVLGVSDDLQEQCYDFANQTIIVFVLRYGSIVFVGLMNLALHHLIERCLAGEAFITHDANQRALFFRRLLATYVNLCLLVLLAYGVTVQRPYSVSEGMYTDFIREWYADGGYFLLLSFLLVIVGPFAWDIFVYCVYQPLRKYLMINEYTLRGGHRVVLQKDLNDIHLGPSFPLGVHLARLSALIFFAMTYAPGLPLLMPITGNLFLCCYMIHRSMLLQFYKVPFFPGTDVMNLVIDILPCAAILRLGFACWMLSADSILSSVLPQSKGVGLGSMFGVSSSSLSLYAYAQYVSELQDTAYLPDMLAVVEDRLKHANVLPCFAFAVIIAVVMGFEYLDKFVLSKVRWVLGRIAWFFYKHCRRRPLDPLAKSAGFLHYYELRSLHDPLRREAAPFTGVYFSFLGRKSVEQKWWKRLIPKRCKKNKEHDLPMGWEVNDMGWDFEVKVKNWASITDDQGARTKGEHKRTYEVINDQRYCSTFRMELLPNWMYTYVGLRELDVDYSISSFYLNTINEQTMHLKFNPALVEDRLNETKRGYRNKVVPIVTEAPPADAPPLVGGFISKPVTEEDLIKQAVLSCPTKNTPAKPLSANRASTPNSLGSEDEAPAKSTETNLQKVAPAETAVTVGSSNQDSTPRKRFVIDEDSSGGEEGSSSGESSSGDSDSSGSTDDSDGSSSEGSDDA